LDEQLAHRLMLEEQQAALSQQEYNQQGGNLPYQPRTNAPRRSSERPPLGEPSLADQFRDFISPRRPNNPQQADSQQGPGAAANASNTGNELSDQFNKIADSMSSHRLIVHGNLFI
jgi:hypothetical protein